jgi:hypothetical protein
MFFSLFAVFSTAVYRNQMHTTTVLFGTLLHLTVLVALQQRFLSLFGLCLVGFVFPLQAGVCGAAGVGCSAGARNRQQDRQ